MRADKGIPWTALRAVPDASREGTQRIPCEANSRVPWSGRAWGLDCDAAGNLIVADVHKGLLSIGPNREPYVGSMTFRKEGTEWTIVYAHETAGQPVTVHAGK
jgi:hypothetical protein